MEDYSAYLIRTLQDPTISRLQFRSPVSTELFAMTSRLYQMRHSSWPVGGTRITLGCEYRYSLEAYHCSNNNNNAVNPGFVSALAAMYCPCLPWSCLPRYLVSMIQILEGHTPASAVFVTTNWSCIIFSMPVTIRVASVDRSENIKPAYFASLMSNDTAFCVENFTTYETGLHIDLYILCDACYAVRMHVTKEWVSYLVPMQP